MKDHLHPAPNAKIRPSQLRRHVMQNMASPTTAMPVAQENSFDPEKSCLIENPQRTQEEEDDYMSMAIADPTPSHERRDPHPTSPAQTA